MGLLKVLVNVISNTFSSFSISATGEEWMIEYFDSGIFKDILTSSYGHNAN